MKQYFETFGALLKQLNGPNVVIGGANSLLAHGLNFGRTPADLDVALYKPTEDQEKTLVIIGTLSENGAYENARVLKFKKDGLSLDLVIHRDTSAPTDLLYYEHKDTFYKVQSVEQCITAKRGYNREKDWKDFADLKQRNFNM
jgi:hypothetical protein